MAKPCGVPGPHGLDCGPGNMPEVPYIEMADHRCLLVRMHYTHAGDLRNCMIRHLTILQGYHGTCLGIGHEAYPIRHGDGRWHDHLAVALFDFENEAWLKLWVASDPEVKQRDWLEGVDIISFPYHQIVDPVKGFDSPWLSIAECSSDSPHTTLEELATLATEAVSDMGDIITLLRPEYHTHYRGLYNPGKMVAVFCNGKGSRCCMPQAEEAPYILPEVDIIMFKLQPLCLPLTSDSNPAAMVI